MVRNTNMKTKQPEDIFDAHHPYQWSAIRIIWEVIFPFVGRGINGEEYYDLEDKITEIIRRSCSNAPSEESASAPEENPPA